jgi:uncharacterized protein YdhG (YjbR/CyaY superfamily)
MAAERVTYTTIDEYIVHYPPEVQAILQRVRETIRKVTPEAQEAIKYGLPTFVLQGKNLVHFGAFQKHIGFYPTPNGLEQFEQKLSVYPRSKGAVQFPLDRPIPYDLIEEITRFRLEQTLLQVQASSKQPAAKKK